MSFRFPYQTTDYYRDRRYPAFDPPTPIYARGLMPTTQFSCRKEQPRTPTLRESLYTPNSVVFALQHAKLNPRSNVEDVSQNPVEVNQRRRLARNLRNVFEDTVQERLPRDTVHGLHGGKPLIPFKHVFKKPCFMAYTTIKEANITAVEQYAKMCGPRGVIEI